MNPFTRRPAYETAALAIIAEAVVVVACIAGMAWIVAMGMPTP